MGHLVTAGYVTVETAVPGGRAEVDIPRGHTLPDDVPAAQLQLLLERGDVRPFSVERVAEAPAGADPGPADGTIAEVMERVGGDPEKALAAWQAEEAKGEKARSTLLRDLAAIVEAAQ